jgi:hypothetical protein
MDAETWSATAAINKGYSREKLFSGHEFDQANPQ